MPKPRLVCLLPARDCAADLDGYFESVARFADAVVALDDGSSDRTRDVLAAQPLVKVLLTNPTRPDYRGWNDRANRNRLLAAAAELEPEWILSLDADERIDSGDAVALRDFVEQDALPGCAYGFAVFRMLVDLSRYDPIPLWVYRLFAFEPGQQFGGRQLHFVPIPTSIPRQRWLRTTVRIQHLGSLTETRRRARFEKYRQADPENTFQRSYAHLLSVPCRTATWRSRPPGLPVITAGPALGALIGQESREPDLQRPVLSAVVISGDDEQHIERAVRSVVEQECAEPFEVIVVTSGTDRTAEIVRQRFPQVSLVELPRPALPGGARNAGFRVARGDYITFPGSHVELLPGSLAARLRAHRLGYDMVEGTMLNGTQTPAGWASYFLGATLMLPGRPSEQLRRPAVACSYARELLLDVGGFPEDMRTGEDSVVNRELKRRGHAAYRAQDVLIIHHSPCRSLPVLLRHHFQRGQGLGRILLADDRERGHLLRRRRGFLRSYVCRRVARTTRHVKRWGVELLPMYQRVFPLVVAGAVAAWAGACYELLRPAPGKLRILFGSGLPETPP